MLKVGPLGLNTLTFILNLLHWAVCFHCLIELPKHLHRMIWRSLEEVLDMLCHSYKILVSAFIFGPHRENFHIKDSHFHLIHLYFIKNI